MKTIGVEIERRQIAMTWVSVPSHWDFDRIHREIARVIDEVADAPDSVEWGMVYGPQYFVSAVIGVNAHAEFEPDYCFPDEAPPAHPDQTALEL